MSKGEQVVASVLYATVQTIDRAEFMCAVLLCEAEVKTPLGSDSQYTVDSVQNIQRLLKARSLLPSPIGMYKRLRERRKFVVPLNRLKSDLLRRIDVALSTGKWISIFKVPGTHHQSEFLDERCFIKKDGVQVTLSLSRAPIRRWNTSRASTAGMRVPAAIWTMRT